MVCVRALYVEASIQVSAEGDLAQQDLTPPGNAGAFTRGRSHAGVEGGDDEGGIEVGFHEQIGCQQPNESRRCSGWQEPPGMAHRRQSHHKVPVPVGVNGHR